MNTNSQPTTTSELTESSYFVEPATAVEGRFEKIVQLDSAGATSQAYVATIQGRDYFMKRLRPELRKSPTYRNLLRKEYYLGRQISSTHVIGYEEFFEDEADCYLICEYVYGETLGEWMISHPNYFKSLSNLEKFFFQLLSGVEALHKVHVVHCDLKPQNIMLTNIGGNVKIIDLGYVCHDSFVSTVGATNRYAAPEQLKGREKDTIINETTDVYAIGNMLKYISEQGKVKLPTAYRQVMKRCLQPQQENRFQNVAELRNEFIKIGKKKTLKRLLFLGMLLLMLVGALFFNTGKGKVLQQRIMWSLTPIESDVLEGNTYYRFISPDSSTCEIVGFRADTAADMSSQIILPNGRISRVKGVANRALMNASFVEAFFFEDGIEYIGENALAGTNIVTINLPSSVKRLGDQAFERNEKLRTLILSDSIQVLPKKLCVGCTNLEKVKLPKFAVSLGFDMFALCKNLTQVETGDHIVHIERGVFWECRSLSELTLPATLRQIDEYAFYHCTSLRHIYLYAEIPPVVINSFKISQCAQLKVHVLPEALPLYQKHREWSKLNLVGDLKPKS